MREAPAGSGKKGFQSEQRDVSCFSGGTGCLSACFVLFGRPENHFRIFYGERVVAALNPAGGFLGERLYSCSRPPVPMADRRNPSVLPCG